MIRAERENRIPQKGRVCGERIWNKVLVRLGGARCSSGRFFGRRRPLSRCWKANQRRGTSEDGEKNCDSAALRKIMSAAGTALKNMCMPTRRGGTYTHVSGRVKSMQGGDQGSEDGGWLSYLAGNDRTGSSTGQQIASSRSCLLYRSRKRQ